jgi:hypothetical protein
MMFLEAACTPDQRSTFNVGKLLYRILLLQMVRIQVGNVGSAVGCRSHWVVAHLRRASSFIKTSRHPPAFSKLFALYANRVFDHGSPGIITYVPPQGG